MTTEPTHAQTAPSDDASTEPAAVEPVIEEVAADLQTALDDRDWSRAVRLVGMHWSMLLDEPGDRLDHALRAIPLNAFEQDARAAAVRDIRLHSSADAVDRMLGTASLPDADDLAKLEAIARSDRALSLLSVASSRMIALRVRGRLSRAIRLAGLVERFSRIAVVHQPALVASRVPAALLHAGITRGLADDLSGAVLALRDAFERAPESRAPYVERDAAGKSALFLALGGDVAQAGVWLERHDRAPEAQGWYRPRIALTADVARALIATEGLRRADAAAAVNRLDQPVNAEQGWGPAVSYARARHALAWGDRLGAVEALRLDRERYADWLGEDSTLGPLLMQAEVDLLLSLGQTQQAKRAVDGQAEHPAGHVARARIALLEGDLVGASRRSAAALGQSLTTRGRVDALVVHALASEWRGTADAGVAARTDLVAAVRDRGLLLAALAVPEESRGGLDDLLPEAHGARDTLRADPDRIRITPQQQLVLDGLAQDLSIREIAAAQHLSINTVKSHARALYRRLEVTTRDEVVARAYELGLL
ncbi:LuxR C-terminal-related transcriptional regulator [Microbacterium sp. 179-I 3D4 NHS]|uniref:LuxR C-terminal-related transcriptional regulator n=1 Tax=Microbacterium sp. 179-I 3D4 NHS TaxID=3142381 RepID=UPI0039A38C8E